MRISPIVGVGALVGVVVLIGFAVTDDRRSEPTTPDTSPFVFDEATASSLGQAATAVEAAPSTTR